MAQTVSVREVMSAEYLGVHEGESVSRVAAVLAEHREDTAVVLDGSEPIGIALAVDLLDALLAGDRDEPIVAHMREPITTVEPTATIEHAIELMATAETDDLIVIDLEDNAIGVVNARDLLSGVDGLLEDHLEATIPRTGDRSPPSISEQGVCESCGRLADVLHESDGSLLCVACAEL